MKLTSIILLIAILTTATIAYAEQSTCPDGGEWTKIDSDDLSEYPVPDATEYCFKAGSDNSQGCIGGLFDSWPQPDGTCGLSHWSYRINEPIPEPDPSATDEPQEWTNYTSDSNCDGWIVYSQEYVGSEPISEPEEEDYDQWFDPESDESFLWEDTIWIEEPQNCNEEPTQTPEPTITSEPTETPEEFPTPTPTQMEPTPTATEERLPSTGDGLSTGAWLCWGSNVYCAHNGVPGSEAEQWVFLYPGATINFQETTYQVESVERVTPEEIQSLDNATDYDVVLLTCTNYSGGVWLNRIIIFANRIP